MLKSKKKSCMNCGYIPPKAIVDLEKQLHCKLCDENYLLKDAKEHKKNYNHLLKSEVIKKIKNLDFTNQNSKDWIKQIGTTIKQYLEGDKKANSKSSME